MKKVIKIIGGLLGILSPLPYFYALDNFEKFSGIVKFLGFIGYAAILYWIAIYLFRRDIWDRFIDKN